VSPVWAFAVALLALLVLALVAVVTKLLGTVAATDRTVARLRQELNRLEDPQARGALEGAPSQERAESALVQLDPTCDGCRRLALDLQASGVPSDPGIAVRLLVEDTEPGRRLTDGLLVERVPAGWGPTAPPHVLVVARDGRVLAEGDPTTADELERLLAPVA
jgi:hypothetical protein